MTRVPAHALTEVFDLLLLSAAAVSDEQLGALYKEKQTGGDRR